MKLLKEPLLHFVLIGALIFGFYSAFDPAAGAAGEREIRVSPGRILQLSEIFKTTWQRPPTREELQGLVNDFILEEIYYREATAAGLDHNDTLIRRRLRQKMEFLRDDLAVGAPDDKQLSAFVQTHPERFRQPSSTSFRQIFFNPDKLGAKAEEVLRDTSAQLEEGQEPEGHPTLLPSVMTDASPAQITGSFGEDFAKALVDLKVGEWSRPIRSGFGFHFVRIDERSEGTLPSLEEIRRVAQREWEHEQRNEFRQRVEKELLQKYDVSIEWPQMETAER